MNGTIVEAILRIDRSFYPELQRYAEPTDLLDIYQAKIYLKRLVNDANLLLPPSNGKTLLNRLLLQYNCFIRCFSSPELLLSALPTLVSAERLSHNRQFDSLWGVLNLFSSFDKKTVEAAFLMLADEFEEILEEFEHLGFPSVREGLSVMCFLLDTVGGAEAANERTLSSVYLYLIRLLQTLFLQEPLRIDGPQAFFRDFHVYLANKYPDGFDRIYSELRSSFMIIHEISYQKELIFVNEANFITSATLFRIDKLFSEHFVSKTVAKQRDPACAFYAVINYVLNVFIEVYILTGHQNIETGLLHMHDVIYNSESVKRVEQNFGETNDFLEAENMQLTPTEFGIIGDLQMCRTAEDDVTNATHQGLTLVETEDASAGLGTGQIRELCSYEGSNFIGYATSILANTQKLVACRENVHLLVDRFVEQHLSVQAHLGTLSSELQMIQEETLERVQQEKSHRVSPAEIVEILAGNLEQLDLHNFPSVEQLPTELTGTLSPVSASLYLLSALQSRSSSCRLEKVPVDSSRLISELKQLQTELRVKELSLRLSRTDVVVITAKAICEAQDYYRRHEALFARHGITARTTPDQIMQNSIKLADIPRARFTDYFENLPVCACGPLANITARLVRLIGEMIIAGFDFGIEEPANVIREGQSLSQISIKLSETEVVSGEMVDVELGEAYAYYGLEVFVEIDESIVENWIGGDEESGFRF